VILISCFIAFSGVEYNFSFFLNRITNNVGCPVADCAVDLGPNCKSSNFFRFRGIKSHILYPRSCTFKRTLRFLWVPRWLQVLVWCQLRREPSQFPQLLLWSILHPREMPGLWCCFLQLLQYVNFPLHVFKSNFDQLTRRVKLPQVLCIRL
jgi:hypothetical protein